MKRWEVVLMSLLWLALSIGFLYGCTTTKTEAPVAPRPVQMMTPQSKLIFHGGQALFFICEPGTSNKIYLNEAGDFQVLPGGCGL
jgi:hypothetical protein